MIKILLIFLLPFASLAQHTFSIVAVDSVTNEIGSAGATCIGSKDGALVISDIVLGKGAVHTQAFYTGVNQLAARDLMIQGKSADEIISWLQENDNPAEGGDINERQYGVVELNNGHPRSAAFTGNGSSDQKGHRVGPGYSIQGNILISQDVLNDMENAYLNTTGTLAEKLMAVLQAAKRPGADSRCLEEGVSSASSFIRVAKPTDVNSAYGLLWLDINVWANSGKFTGDPIDELQKQYNTFIKNAENSNFKVFPNPTTGILSVYVKEQEGYFVKVSNSFGATVFEYEFKNNQIKLDLRRLKKGVYFVEVFDKNKKRTLVEKIMHL